MRDIIKISLKLFLITAIAGLALGVTYNITGGPIAAQAEATAIKTRQTVLPEAAEFVDITTESDSVVTLPDNIDNAYMGIKDSETIGYTAQITVKGYGGDIEIMVGMNMEGKITGVSIGGSNFSETPGLGANARESWFSEMFIGLEPEIVLNEDVDAITAATITSQAVTNGVNDACEFILTLIGGAAA